MDGCCYCAVIRVRGAAMWCDSGACAVEAGHMCWQQGPAAGRVSAAGPTCDGPSDTLDVHDIDVCLVLGVLCPFLQGWMIRMHTHQSGLHQHCCCTCCWGVARHESMGAPAMVLQKGWHADHAIDSCCTCKLADHWPQLHTMLQMPAAWPAHTLTMTKLAVPLLPLSSCASAAVTYTPFLVSAPALSCTCKSGRRQDL
jgi:hypothetical protein